MTLDPEQLRCASLPLGPVAVVAGPGAGKTRTVVARIAALVARGEVDPSKVVALTHTTKAAGELTDRLASAGVQDVRASTVHALAWRQVRRFAPELGLDVPTLLGSTFGAVRDAARPLLGNPDASVVAELCSEIDWAAARGLTTRSYARAAAKAGRSVSVEPATVTAVWRKYSERKRRRNEVDFADVLALAAAQLDDPAVHSVVEGMFDAVFVDEYQDIDVLQQRCIDAWLCGKDALCVVGDADQAIFGFKGGDPDLLLGFARRYPSATVVNLSRNYRSTLGIVSWVNAVATHKDVPLTSERGTGRVPRVETFPTESAEESAVAAQLHAWKRAGFRWKDLAVLFRYNASSARLEGALSAAGVPYAVAGGTNFFDRSDVRGVLVSFGAAARRDGSADGLEVLVDAAAEHGWWRDDVPAGMGAARQRYDAILALVELVAERYPGWDAASLLAGLQERARQAHDVPVDAVTLATVHAAKGLEWPCVWVVSCTDGVMPSSYAKTTEQRREERHLFYVALSRAADELVVSTAARRHNNFTGRPSPFLDLLPAATSAGRSAGAPTAGTSAQHPSDNGSSSVAVCPCGARLVGAAARKSKSCSGRCLQGEAAERFAALVSWRDSQAAKDGVAARDVASDKALFAVAVFRRAEQVAGLAYVPPRRLL